MKPPSNTDITSMDPGDVLHIHSPGGGGRGSPLWRGIALVLQDVRRGYVSVAAAGDGYGVVIKGDAVDMAATAARRAELRQAETGRHFFFGPERDAFEQVWCRDAYTAMTEIIDSLPVQWRFFMKSRLFGVAPKLVANNVAQPVQVAVAQLRTSYPEMFASSSKDGCGVPRSAAAAPEKR